MKEKHYNTITSFVPYKNMKYMHTIKYLLFSLIIYYLLKIITYNLT
jgi:hypothetical protein